MKLNKKELYEWLRRSEDIKMADGTTVRKYHLEFDTTDYKAVQYLEKIFAEIMDDQITFETLFSNWEGEPYIDGEFDWEDSLV